MVIAVSISCCCYCYARLSINEWLSFSDIRLSINCLKISRWANKVGRTLNYVENGLFEIRIILAHCSWDIVSIRFLLFSRKNGVEQNVPNSSRALFIFFLHSHHSYHHHLQLMCYFLSLTTAFDGLEPHNGRKSRSEHRIKREKSNIKTLLSAYFVARVKFPPWTERVSFARRVRLVGVRSSHC